MYIERAKGRECIWCENAGQVANKSDREEKKREGYNIKTEIKLHDWAIKSFYNELKILTLQIYLWRREKRQKWKAKGQRNGRRQKSEKYKYKYINIKENTRGRYKYDEELKNGDRERESETKVKRKEKDTRWDVKWWWCNVNGEQVYLQYLRSNRELSSRLR